MVVSETVKNILQPDKIQLIAKRCAELSARDFNQNDELKHLQKQLAETNKAIKNLVAALEQGIFSKTTQDRLAELEVTKEKLEFELESHKAKQPTLTEKHIVFMLSQFQRETTDNLAEYNEHIIDCFVNSVHLYNDKMIVTYNLTDNEKRTELMRSVLDTLPSSDDKTANASGSDFEKNGGPSRTRT